MRGGRAIFALALVAAGVTLGSDRVVVVVVSPVSLVVALPLGTLGIVFPIAFSAIGRLPGDLALALAGPQLRVGHGVLDYCAVLVVKGFGDFPGGEEGGRVHDLGPILPEDPCRRRSHAASIPGHTDVGFGIEGADIAHLAVLRTEVLSPRQIALLPGRRMG